MSASGPLKESLVFVIPCWAGSGRTEAPGGNSRFFGPPSFPKGSREVEVYHFKLAPPGK